MFMMASYLNYIVIKYMEATYLYICNSWVVPLYYLPMKEKQTDSLKRRLYSTDTKADPFNFCTIFQSKPLSQIYSAIILTREKLTAVTVSRYLFYTV